MSIAREYAELLKLIEVTGPFISLPVYKDVFPQGVMKDDTRCQWQNKIPQKWRLKNPQAA